MRALLMLVLLNLVPADSHDRTWVNLERDDLCVTDGAIEGHGSRLSVDVPQMRAYVTRKTAQEVEMRFTYGGGTRQVARLGSGAVRRQFGLKLRAQDPCNLVYAIWRVAPESKLVVSIKRNPGQQTSAQCHNHGYTDIKPRKISPVPRLRAGDSHTLRAEINRDELRVFVDNHEVWEGELGRQARLEGPVGLRSDNARLEFDLKVHEREGHDHGDHDRDRREPCQSGESD